MTTLGGFLPHKLSRFMYTWAMFEHFGALDEGENRCFIQHIIFISNKLKYNIAADIC